MKAFSKKTILGMAMTSIAVLSSGLVISSNAAAGELITKQKLINEKQIDMNSQANHVAALAQREFKNYINGSAKATLAEMPLSLYSMADLKRATIAYGFEVFTINPKDILDGRQDLKDVVQGSGIWRFMIKVDQTPVGLMTVEYAQGKWQATEFGAAGLAKDLDEQMGMYGNASRNNMKFVRIYQAQADFMLVSKPSEGKVQFAPLNSARLSLNLPTRQAELAVSSTSAKGMALSKSELLDGRDILNPLQAAVKRSLNTAY